MENGGFRRISTKRSENPRFAVVEDQVLVRGHLQPFYYTEIREGVCILTFYKEKIALLKEYRYPVGSWQWEIPGGIVDSGETPEQAAVRELKEETGLVCDTVTSLGSFYTSFGSSNEKIHLFCAHCKKIGEASPEPAEVFALHLFDEAEFVGMIREGEFMHGAGLAAWARYLSRG